MRHFTLAATGNAFVALLSSAPAMARAHNTDNIGWNRGGPYKTDTTAGSVPQCFVAGEKVPCASNAPTAAPIFAGSDFSKMRGHFDRGQGFDHDRRSDQPRRFDRDFDFGSRLGFDFYHNGCTDCYICIHC